MPPKSGILFFNRFNNKTYILKKLSKHLQTPVLIVKKRNNYFRTFFEIK